MGDKKALFWTIKTKKYSTNAADALLHRPHRFQVTTVSLAHFAVKNIFFVF
jgi:hypothetical protein